MEMPRKMEEIIEDLRTQGFDDIAEELEAYTGTALRKKLEEAEGKLRRLEEVEAELAALKLRPKVEKAFRDYGVDLDSLRPLEREALLSQKFQGEVPTPEEIGELAERYQLPTTGTVEVAAEEEPPAAGIVETAVRAPAGKAVGTTLGPEDVASWSTDKLMQFREKHPEEWQALMRGERVSAPAP
jgi:hypothetical protein